MPLPWKRNLSDNLSPEAATRSHTEKIAYELFQTRQLLKRSGDQTTDWETAEKIVRNPVRKALYRCHRPFIQVEKNIWEPLLSWANNQALLSLLGVAGNIGLIIAVVTYIGSEKHRRNAEVLNAWQTITSTYGQAGSGGRIQSLEFLNASPGANWRRKFPWFCAPLSLCVWPAENLSGINLAVDSVQDAAEKSDNDAIDNRPTATGSARVYLVEIQLPNATLEVANLEGAILWGANLSSADLLLANLAGADLRYANLEGAILWGANLEGADLKYANLSSTILLSANLAGTDLLSANLSSANLSVSNLAGADLRYANLAGADLLSANLAGTDLRRVNLESATGLETEQVAQARLCFTALPPDIKLPADRDCVESDFAPNIDELLERSPK